VIKFQDLGDGETIDLTYKTKADTSGEVGTGTEDASLKRGGTTFKIWNASLDTNSDFDILVDLDGNGAIVDAARLAINTKGGAKIELLGTATLTSGDHLGDGVTINVTTPNSDDYDNKEPSPVSFNLTAASGEVAAAETTGITFTSPSDEDNAQYLYTTMGAFVKYESPTSAPDTVDIWYPKTQRLPLLFVTSGDVVASQSSTAEGQLVYYETTEIEVGTAKLSSEVTDIRAQNAIIVGGPCINPAAADVMGFPQPCGQDFEEGKAMIKIFAHTNGNVALLVAGYEAMDTRRAARVLSNYEVYADQLQGTEVEVAGTTFADITVSAPAVMEAEVEATTDADADADAAAADADADAATTE